MAMIEPVTLFSAYLATKAMNSKAAAKLVECLRQSAAWYFAPLQEVRMARARAQTALIEDDTRTEIERRALTRVLFNETRRQKNIDDTLRFTVDVLPSTDDISDEPIGPDWLVQFFACVQDISNEQLQRVFASILANEIVKPGRCSRRTLDLLKNLEQSEAATFTTACSIAVHTPDFGFVAIPDGRAHGLPVQGLDLPLLRACGLLTLQPVDNLSFWPGAILHLCDGGRLRIGQRGAEMAFIVFTTAGRELAQVVRCAAPQLVRQKVVETLRHWYTDMEIVDPIVQE